MGNPEDEEPPWGEEVPAVEPIYDGTPACPRVVVVTLREEW